MRYLATIALLLFLASTPSSSAPGDVLVDYRLGPEAAIAKLRKLGVREVVLLKSSTPTEVRAIERPRGERTELDARRGRDHRTGTFSQFPKPGGFWMLGSCDTDKECGDTTDQMCKDAKLGGVVRDKVKRHLQLDGSTLCEGACEQGGSAYVLCVPEDDPEEPAAP
jgi:hypothetical protein